MLTSQQTPQSSWMPPLALGSHTLAQLGGVGGSGSSVAQFPSFILQMAPVLLFACLVISREETHS